MYFKKILIFIMTIINLTVLHGCGSEKATITLEKNYEIKKTSEISTKYFPVDFVENSHCLYILEWKDVEGKDTILSTPVLSSINRLNQEIVTVSLNDIKLKKAHGGILTIEKSSHVWLWAIEETDLILYEYDKNLNLLNYSVIQTNQPIIVVKKAKNGFLAFGENSILLISDQSIIEKEYIYDFDLINDLTFIKENAILVANYDNKKSETTLCYLELLENELKEIKSFKFSGFLKFVQSSPMQSKILILNQTKNLNSFYIIETSNFSISQKITLPGFQKVGISFSVAMPNEQDIYIDGSKANNTGVVVERKIFAFHNEKMIGSAAVSPLDKGLHGVFVEKDKLIFYELKNDIVSEYRCDIDTVFSQNK